MNDYITYKETNTELVEQCRRGDHQAFRKLYDLYSKAMFNLCLRMLNNREEAEDVLQESFISAFRNIHQYSGSVSFGSWLKRIVINRCLDGLKKRNPGFIPLEEADLPEEQPGGEPGITCSVEKIREAIAQLADGYRVIVTLYLFEGFSHKMIAERLGISEGTSKSQYARAKKRLMEWITLNTENHA